MQCNCVECAQLRIFPSAGLKPDLQTVQVCFCLLRQKGNAINSGTSIPPDSYVTGWKISLPQTGGRWPNGGHIFACHHASLGIMTPLDAGVFEILWAAAAALVRVWMITSGLPFIIQEVRMRCLPNHIGFSSRGQSFYVLYCIDIIHHPKFNQ